MFKISRFFLDGFGTNSSFYRDFEINFLDDEKRAKDAVIYGISGTGKTTFLSAFFTLFSPLKRHFISQRRDKNVKISDYYHKEPTVVLAEIPQEDNGLGFGREYLVIGQIIREYGEDSVQRMMFMFKHSNGIKEVPHRYYQKENFLQSWSEWESWLKRRSYEERKSKNFRMTRHPKEFSNYLEEEDIDTFLIQKQVALNLQEQGDLAGMSFETEEEFLLFFFDFTLDEIKIEKNRQQVQEWVGKIVDLPEYKDTLALYEEVLPHTEMLVEKVKTYNTVSMKSSGKRNKMYLLYHESLRSKKVLFDSLESLNGEFNKLDTDNKKIIEEKKNEEKNRTYLQWKIFDDEYNKANGDYQGLEKKYREKNSEYELVKCAGSFDRYLSTQRRYEEIKEQIERQDKDIQPLIQNQKESASALFDAIEKKRAKYTELKDKAYEDFENAKKEIEKLNNTNKTLDKRINSLGRERGIIQSRLDDYKRKVKEFEKEGVISDNESKEEAFNRLELEFNSIEKEIVKYKKTIKDLEKKEKDYQTEFSDYTKQQESYKKSLERVISDIEKAKTKKDELEDKNVLSISELDLYTQDYTKLIEERIEKKNNELIDYKARLKKFEEEIGYIDEFGTGKPDKNTEYAIELLKRNGIGHAIYYPTYISNITATDVNKARALVASNVGRFMGIAVESQESLEKVKTIQSEGLHKPITVSLMTNKIENSSNDIVSLMPKHDYVYNKESAQRRKNTLEQEVKALTNELITPITESLVELNLYRDELKNFYSNYNHEQVKLWEKEKTDYDLKLDEVIEKSSLLEEKKERLEEELDDAKENLEKIDISEITVVKSRLKSFINDYKNIEQDVDRQVEIEKKIEDILKEVSENEKNIIGLEGKKTDYEKDEYRYKNTLLEIENSEKTALKLSNRDDKISYSERYVERVKKFDLEGLLDDLEEYSNQVQSYMNKNDQSQLKISLETNKSKMEVYKNTFDEKLKQANDLLKENYTKEDIEPFITMDYKEYEQIVLKEKEQLESSVSRIKTQKERFEDRLKKYIEENKNYVLNEEQFSKLVDNINVVEVLEKSKSSLESLKAKQNKLESKLEKIKTDIDDNEKPYNSFEQIVDSWQEEYKDKKDMSFFDFDYSDPKVISTQIKQTLEAISVIEKNIKAYRREIERTFQKVTNKFTDILQEKSMLKSSEKMIIEDINRLTIEDIIDTPSQIHSAIVDRMIVLQSNIERLKKSEGTAIDYLGRIAKDAINVLKDISSTKLPENAGAFANRSIITVNISSVKSMSEITQQEILSSYLNTLVESQVVPNWKLLCSGIIKFLLQGRGLGLKLLLVDEYNLSGKMVKPLEHNLSDGQKLIFQVMMYIALSRIRYRTHSTSVGREFQGFMVIDNPFGKNTNKETIVPKLELGHAMGIQFIYTMEQENNEMFNLFENVYVLRRNKKIGDKQMVEVAHLGMDKEKSLGR